MCETKFKVGDVVYLKSDLGQKMTVKQVVKEEAICVYFDKEGRLSTNYFIPETLVLDTEIQTLIAKMKNTEEHCKAVEKNNSELRKKVASLEKEIKRNDDDVDFYKRRYNLLESKYTEYADWLVELGELKNPQHRMTRTRAEWIELRNSENEASNVQ